MHINCCRWAAEPGPGAELVSIWQQSDPTGMQKAPKNTGYQEDVLYRGGTTRKEDGLAGRHGAGQRKNSLVVCGSLLYVHSL